MLDKLISGKPLASFLRFIFAIPEALLLIVINCLRFLRWLLVKVIFSKLDSLIASKARKLIARKTKIKKNNIIFVTTQYEYTCNPKYIAEEIIRRGLPYKIQWVISENTVGPFPPEVSLLQNTNAKFHRHLAAAKIVITNGHTLQRAKISKNPKQYWIQTWHGSLGLKKLEGAGGREKFYQKIREMDSKQTDFLLSNSEFEDSVFNTTYWPGVPIKRLGHARNDILFDSSEVKKAHLRKKVISRLGIKEKNQKFLLFAPTHDDTNKNQSFGHLDFAELSKVLTAKFGGEWEFLIRTHNTNKAKSDAWLAGLPDFCHNASFYPDMQELLVVADSGITDYSSWICDFIITKKPSFLFGANIDSFNETRGFYHDFADTPFSLSTSNDELFRNISAFSQSEYSQRIDDFFLKCGFIDSGESASNIVDFVEEIMNLDRKSGK